MAIILSIVVISLIFIGSIRLLEVFHLISEEERFFSCEFIEIWPSFYQSLSSHLFSLVRLLDTAKCVALSTTLLLVVALLLFETKDTLSCKKPTISALAEDFANLHGLILFQRVIRTNLDAPIMHHVPTLWELSLKERHSLSCGLLEITLPPTRLQATFTCI